ncbi:MAG: hypothetical protein ACYCY6_02515 [Minisyncoccota bacterium]
MESKPLRVNRSLQDEPWPLVIVGAISTGFCLYLLIVAIFSLRDGNFFSGLWCVILASVLAAPILDRYKKN